MTESNNISISEGLERWRDPERWRKILGPLEPKADYLREIQENPGLVTVTIEGEELCPVAQFLPDGGGKQIYPKLADGWELARQSYGHHDPTGLVTATIFATAIPELGGVSLFDVLTREDTEEAWNGARDFILAASPFDDDF